MPLFGYLGGGEYADPYGLDIGATGYPSGGIGGGGAAYEGGGAYCGGIEGGGGE